MPTGEDQRVDLARIHLGERRGVIDRLLHLRVVEECGHDRIVAIHARGIERCRSSARAGEGHPEARLGEHVPRVRGFAQVVPGGLARSAERAVVGEDDHGVRSVVLRRSARGKGEEHEQGGEDAVEHGVGRGMGKL